MKSEPEREQGKCKSIVCWQRGNHGSCAKNELAEEKAEGRGRAEPGAGGGGGGSKLGGQEEAESGEPGKSGFQKGDLKGYRLTMATGGLQGVVSDHGGWFTDRFQGGKGCMDCEEGNTKRVSWGVSSKEAEWSLLETLGLSGGWFVLGRVTCKGKPLERESLRRQREKFECLSPTGRCWRSEGHVSRGLAW